VQNDVINEKTYGSGQLYVWKGMTYLKEPILVSVPRRAPYGVNVVDRNAKARRVRANYE
jgi:hypothetical protein